MLIDFKNSRFAVVGLGDTGISIIKYLQFMEANLVKIFDTRNNPPHLSDIKNAKLCLGSLKFINFNDIDVIVISPGVSIYEKALQEAITRGKTVVGDIELFAQAIKDWSSKVIGITGSNGKTTVTTLTGYLSTELGLNTLVAGNIGTPVLNSYIEIVKSNSIPDIIVLELSSFQLESTYSLQLDAATVLNISEDHLDRYRDLLEYAYVKANIFNNCKVQVLNKDDLLVMAMQRHNKPTVYFGNSADFNLTNENNKTYLTINKTKYLQADELGLVGRHNYYNVLASLALLSSIGLEINNEQIKNVLKNFQGLEHRMQKVTRHNGVLYIEDSKGTNVGAVVAGVSGLDGFVHIILGGDGKGQDFYPLRDLVIKKCKSVALIGQDKLAIAKILDGIDIPIESFVTLEDAVSFSIKHAKSGDNVVLSPACASWDMFDNYKHRAQVFVDSILKRIQNLN